MTGFLMWLGPAVAVALVGLLLGEVWAWFPWIAERFVRRAVSVLPSEQQDRYEQEWLAELEALPGLGLWKLVFALRLLARARPTGAALGAVPTAEAVVWRALRRTSAWIVLAISVPAIVLTFLFHRVLRRVRPDALPTQDGRWGFCVAVLEQSQVGTSMVFRVARGKTKSKSLRRKNGASDALFVMALPAVTCLIVFWPPPYLHGWGLPLVWGTIGLAGWVGLIRGSWIAARKQRQRARG